MTIEQRIKQALDYLEQLDIGPKGQAYDGDKVKYGKAQSAPPSGVDLDCVSEGTTAPLMNLSAYRHFAWKFVHLPIEADYERLALLVVAEGLIRTLKNPGPGRGAAKVIIEEDGTERRELGSELNERLLVEYQDYPSDLVDVLEDLKSGYTRSVRDSNHCDAMGRARGVPEWKLREFAQSVSAGVQRERIKTQFQISEGTYWNKLRLCREKGLLF
ncbi:MAG: hypothetical protein JHC87_01770 [Thermoleophilaceae bacterium]|nr:hypothetical protein [Thermoleophilaceae bacterium]